MAPIRQGQGKRHEARELLQPVYDWFTEGLGTPPLVEARALLDAREGSPTPFPN